MECVVFFKTKINATSKDDLEEKAESIAKEFSKKIKKKVEAHSAMEVKKEDTVQPNLFGVIK